MSKRSVTDIGLPELTLETIEEIAELVEKRIRNYIFSKIGKENVYDIDVTVSIEHDETLDVTIDIDLTLSPLFRDIKEKLETEALDIAFECLEKRLREIADAYRLEGSSKKKSKEVSQ
ncbi:MAG: DUF3194 domain-containing protein [Candidatus Asgardarchaeum sp.]|mgnify:CR=1 FL=1|nr:DUF3194 domain-containing protein [Candidatus Odinarchaeota archaeon]